MTASSPRYVFVLTQAPDYQENNTADYRQALSITIEVTLELVPLSPDKNISEIQWPFVKALVSLFLFLTAEPAISAALIMSCFVEAIVHFCIMISMLTRHATCRARNVPY